APFTAFTFAVEVRLPGRDEPLCEAAFSACDGLELRRQTVAYREGGASGVRLVAAGESVGNVTLRRGMTAALDLWEWWERVRRALDERFEHEIDEPRWLTAQLNPERLHTSAGSADDPRARLDVRLTFDVEAPLPAGCESADDVLGLIGNAAWFATPRRAPDGSL